MYLNIYYFVILITCINKQTMSFFSKKLNNYLGKLDLAKYKSVDLDKYIRTLNNENKYGKDDSSRFIIENEFMKNKKIISISPGGFKGFYMLGVCKFIKKNYNLDNFVFTGASAGAWNSLLLCFKRDIDEIQEKLTVDSLQNIKNLKDIENQIKANILENYKTEDFDLRRLFIGVTALDNYKSQTVIFTGFENLEDAVNCCIASSHIPFLTGGLINNYRNVSTFDGGFSKFPYLNISTHALHITPQLWNKTSYDKKLELSDYTTLFSKDKFQFHELVDKGYADSLTNKEKLDTALG